MADRRTAADNGGRVFDAMQLASRRKRWWKPFLRAGWHHSSL